MKSLYFQYALNGKGVSEEDYMKELENISGISFSTFFKEFVHGTNPYEAILTESFDYLGLEMNQVPAKLFFVVPGSYFYLTGQSGKSPEGLRTITKFKSLTRSLRMKGFWPCPRHQSPKNYLKILSNVN